MLLRDYWQTLTPQAFAERRRLTLCIIPATRRVKLGLVRILACYLPSKRPWLNPIEPKWLHGKRAIVEPARLLPADELADRVCARFDCVHEPHLVAPEKVP